MTLRDASDLLEHRVRATLDALELTGADEAAKDLAIRYARVIDESWATGDAKIRAWAMRWIAPLLKDVLNDLGGTPAARASMSKGKPAAPDKPGGLAQLRAARK